MRSRLSKTCLIAAAALTLFVPAIFVPGVDAQKQGAPMWYKVATVTRVKKPDRKPSKPLPKTQDTNFLTLQWRLLKQGDNGVKLEADPNQVFRTGDKLKLAVTTNQSGFLYIIHRMNNGDGKLVFPDPRSNNGLNEVKKNQEYVVPSFCPSFPENDCWWRMDPPTGRENFVVVFSRDPYDKLPSRVAVDNGDYEYPVIQRDLIEDLINTSRQRVKEATGRLTIPGKRPARFATRLQNINREDNEELIGRIQLKHGD
jgi:hypothetical protein